MMAECMIDYVTNKCFVDLLYIQSLYYNDWSGITWGKERSQVRKEKLVWMHMQ